MYIFIVFFFLIYLLCFLYSSYCACCNKEIMNAPIGPSSQESSVISPAETDPEQNNGNV